MLPNTKQVADRVVVLPTGTMVNEGMVKTVVSIIAVLLEDTG